MQNINKKLKKELIELNRQIKEKLQKNLIYDKELLEKMIAMRADKIRQIKTISEGNLLKKYGKRGIVGVDGSIYSVGASYPHYISLMQAKAKSTINIYEDIVLANIHTPLADVPENKVQVNEFSIEERDEKTKANKLTLLELNAAESALEKMNPSIIMMDGSLTRFYNCSKEDWNRFKIKALEKKTIIIGIIEEIKSRELVKKFQGLIPPDVEEIYDRELLFGMLDKGEMFILKDWEVGNINKCFVRTSNDPQAICVDFLKDNEEIIEEIISLVISLTPPDGRGIPLWLDIVDAEVRITEKIAKALVENYIDPDIRHRLLIAKRDKRKM